MRSDIDDLMPNSLIVSVLDVDPGPCPATCVPADTAHPVSVRTSYAVAIRRAIDVTPGVRRSERTITIATGSSHPAQDGSSRWACAHKCVLAPGTSLAPADP